MTLGASLSSDLEAVFSNPGSSESDVADGWSDAISAYALGVVPASIGHVAAKAAFRAALEGFGAPGASVAALQAGLTAFAAQIGLGMAPAFVATPPAGPCPLESMNTDRPATHALAAGNVTSIIDSWFRSGTAVPSGGGSPVPWS